MDFSKSVKEFSLKPRNNSRNGQINFSLKKSELPKNIKSRLPKLKSIKFDLNKMEFE